MSSHTPPSQKAKPKDVHEATAGDVTERDVTTAPKREGRPEGGWPDRNVPDTAPIEMTKDDLRRAVDAERDRFLQGMAGRNTAQTARGSFDVAPAPRRSSYGRGPCPAGDDCTNPSCLVHGETPEAPPELTLEERKKLCGAKTAETCHAIGCPKHEEDGRHICNIPGCEKNALHAQRAKKR